MTIETVPIETLIADPVNARRHPKRNLDAILSSLARFGQQKPIVVDAKNVVRAGNGTLAAAKVLGLTHVDIVRTELIGVEATAFAISDNRTAELAEWDPDVLGAALGEANIGDLGFDETELQKWIGGDDEPPGADDPEPPTEIGEMFQVIVECDTEVKQKHVYERLVAEGFSCRLLTL